MTRWAFATFATVLIAAGLTVLAARFFGKSSSRASLLVSVIAHWLAAYVLWNFAGGLALHFGWLRTYDGAVFLAVALAGGVWQYRTALRAGRERGLAIFVAAQLVWLMVILARNGVFSG